MHHGLTHDRTTPLAGRRLWLFAGTGEGPPLAEALLSLGWQLRVSVVTAQGGRAYGHLPGLELRVGPLGGAAALEGELTRARQCGEGFALVVDGTHPFALTIRQELVAGCRAQGVPLWRLERRFEAPAEAEAQPAGGGVSLLPELHSLGGYPLAGERLLLAIGARELGAAVAWSPGACHHARLLPTAWGLQQAMAAGLAPERVACLRPSGDGAVEGALLRHWGITVILARQSGGRPEAHWRRLAQQGGQRLLLLRRPQAAATPASMDQATLLARLATWRPLGEAGGRGQDGPTGHPPCADADPGPHHGVEPGTG